MALTWLKGLPAWSTRPPDPWGQMGGWDGRYVPPPTPNPAPIPNPRGTPPPPATPPPTSQQGAPTVPPAQEAQPAQGAYYIPEPKQGTTAQYAYKPVRMEADGYVDPNSAAWKKAQSYVASPDNSKLWGVLPNHWQADIATWNPQLSEGWLNAFRAGPNAVIYGGKYMTGYEAAAAIRDLAYQVRDQEAQARKQKKPPEQFLWNQKPVWL